MRTIRRSVVLALVVGALVAPAPRASARHGRASGGKSQSARATSIDLCCAWGRGLSDGLTFSVSGPSRTRSIMSQAVRQWASAVKGLRLTEVAPGKPADVTIGFKAVSGNTQGRTTVQRDRSGFVTYADIFVAGSYNGRPNSTDVFAQITRHEFGHALGLKHANGDGDLMSPTVQGGATGISACDVRGVTTANHWYLVARSSQPTRPPATKVAC